VIIANLKEDPLLLLLLFEEILLLLCNDLHLLFSPNASMKTFFPFREALPTIENPRLILGK
jgi:hypothetical protein